MKSPWIAGLRSVALTVPDLAAAEAFYTRIWRLDVAARGDGALYLRGSGSDHHLLALHAAPGTPRIRQVTLRARSAQALDAIAAGHAGGRRHGRARDRRRAADPAGGTLAADPRRATAGASRSCTAMHGARPTTRAPHDQPLRLAHAVLNSHDVAATQAFFERALGFVLADRTRIMAFMNCDARPPQHRARRHRQRRAEPHRLPDARRSTR